MRPNAPRTTKQVASAEDLPEFIPGVTDMVLHSGVTQEMFLYQGLTIQNDQGIIHDGLQYGDRIPD